MSSALKKYFTGSSNKKNTITTTHKSEDSRPGRSSIITFHPPHGKPQLQRGTKTVMKCLQSRYRMNTLTSNSTKLSQKIAAKEERTLNQIYHHKMPKNKNLYELRPKKMLEPIRLIGRPSSSSSNASYLSLSSSRTKLTDQYFRQIDNIRMVQRLLLAKPSREVTKKEHQQFYQSHLKYRNHMQTTKCMPSRKNRAQTQPWNN